MNIMDFLPEIVSIIFDYSNINDVISFIRSYKIDKEIQKIFYLRLFKKYNDLDIICNSKYIDLTYVKFIDKFNPKCTDNAMDYAAHNGHLEVVQWLHYKSITESDRYKGCTAWAMDGAAKHGHIEVVQWLHNNCKEGCTIWAMNDAAANGHLDVVKWLYEKYITKSNRNDDCIHTVIYYAAQNGHLDVVKWLCERYFTVFNEYNNYVLDIMAHAVENNHQNIVEWLKQWCCENDQNNTIMNLSEQKN